MTRKKSWLAGLVLALVLLAGCAGSSGLLTELTDAEERQMEFLLFLSEVNAKHKATCGIPWAIPFLKSWTPDLDGLTGRLTEEDMLSLAVKPEAPPETVSVQEAREDIESAFLLLKYAYGAYDYFGGDKVFLPVRDAALADLPDAGTVSTGTLEEILIARLSPVLADGHFRIGSTALGEGRFHYTYYVPDLYFDSSAGLPAELVQPTIDGEGRIRLCLAVLAAPEAAELPASLEIEGVSVALDWIRDEPIERDKTDVFTESVLADGTPLLTAVRMTGSTDEQMEQLARLASCGEEYTDAPVLIWDFRGNRGGDEWYIYNWFQGYAGQPPAKRITRARKCGELYMFAMAHQEKEPDFLPESPCWAWRHDVGRWVESGRLILALQDKGTASAAEYALIDLYTRANTLCIGSGTRGTMLAASNHFFYLPHSGVRLYLGSELAMSMDGTNRDLAGLAPDLWVPSVDALDAAERLIAYYDLTELFQ